ncbi:MAG: bifunctional UDP-sugar hydrolase/5'-nucleotidase [Cyclobacteriaceae bacterium]
MKQKRFLQKSALAVFFLVSVISCNKDDSVKPPNSEDQNLTIFFTNDMHGALEDFAKIKHIVDAERANTNTLLLSAGDIFSGNPIVDQHEDRGFPIIDVMNKTGYDVSVIGNHEFDYGVSTLNDRMDQATFGWVCANVDASSSVLNQPDPYTTVTVGELKITILGLVETNGKQNDVIPSTHPWRVIDLTFQRYSDVITQYENLKESEDADVYIALTHLGSNTDFTIANDFPYFDAIVGGHSNHLNDGAVNGIPVVMAGTRLSHLGKMTLTIRDQEVTNFEISLIDLSEYPDQDAELAEAIADYNDNPEFAEVVGFANSHHERNELGCFYTTAMKEYMNVDLSFQNGGGIRADIDEGDVTRHEIFNMDPFNNGSVVFTMTAREIKDFFIQSGAGLHVSGASFTRIDNDIEMLDEDGNTIGDNDQLTIGINDFLPAIYDDYFSFDDAELRELTSAETVIDYLKTTNSVIDHEGCVRFFRY